MKRLTWIAFCPDLLAVCFASFSASSHLCKFFSSRFLIVDCSKCPLFVSEGHSVAEHLGIDVSTVRRGIKALCKEGFFEKVQVTRFGTNAYRVLSHGEWVARHGGPCAVRTRFKGSADAYEILLEVGQTIREKGTAFNVEPQAGAEKPLTQNGQPTVAAPRSPQPRADESKAGVPETMLVRQNKAV